MKRKNTNIELLLVPTTHQDAEIIGFFAVPDRLEQVNRLPGESLRAMTHRAMWMATGNGPFLVYTRTGRFSETDNSRITQEQCTCVASDELSRLSFEPTVGRTTAEAVE